MAETFEIDFAGSLEEGAGKASSALGGLASQMQGVLGLVGPMGAAVGALAGMLVGAGVAVVGLTVEMGKMAINASEAKAALLAQFSTLAGGPKAGAAMLDTIRQLEGVLPQNEATLGEWADKLLAAGVAAGAIPNALKAVAGAGALVTGGSEKLLGVLTKLNEQGMKGTKIRLNMGMLAGTGVSEAELMKALGMTPAMFERAKKFGTITGGQLSDAIVKILGEKSKGPLEQQMTTLSTVWTKFKDDISKLFEDVNIKPFIDGLKDMLGIFSQSTASGRNLKAMLTGMLNGLFAAAAKVFPYIKVGFLFIIYYAYRTYVGLKQTFSGMQGGGIIAAFAAKMLSNFGKQLHSWSDAILRGAHMAAVLISWIARLVAMFNAGKDAAKNLISGLVGGIDGGTGSVVAAIKRLASSAIGALKGALGISSPSKVTMQLGVHTGAGMAHGLDMSRTRVQASAGRVAVAAVPAPRGSSAGRGGTTIHVGGVRVEVHGGTAEGISEAMVAAVFERLALQEGLGSA